MLALVGKNVDLFSEIVVRCVLDDLEDKSTNQLWKQSGRPTVYVDILEIRVWCLTVSNYALVKSRAMMGHIHCVGEDL